MADLRLIDIDALPVEKLFCIDEVGESMKVYAVDIEVLKKAPVANPDAFKQHAKWICKWDENLGETDVTCSHCGETRTINGCYVDIYGESIYQEDSYCPDCGAIMDLR